MDQPSHQEERVSPAGSPRERLESWKEIAAYLKRDVRTVQRWEKSEGLPVHRHMHGERGTAYADKTELDSWWQSRQPRLEALPELRTAWTFRRPWFVTSAVGLSAVLVIVFAYLAVEHFRSPARPLTGKVTLGVLPFENFSGDPKQEYFSDGLTEEMISQLSLVNPERLRVIARTSAMQYKDTSKSAAQIGHELGADYLLESSFRREGSHVRITTQLVRVNDQTHLWSQNYERDVREILPLESEVAQAIAREIAIKLSPEAQARLSLHRAVDPEAYQLYLQGRYFWNKRNTESLRKAVDYFQHAIEKDPNFALAYSGLADSYSLIDYFQDMSPADRVQRAKAAAQRGLALDDTLAETHTSMAFALNWDRAPGEAEAHLKRALELNPNYATAHHWYGLYLKDTGRLDEAIVEIQRARELDPLSLVINADVGLVYYFARQYDKTIQACQKTLEMDPNFRLAHWELGMAYELKRMYPEAVREYEITVSLAPDFPPMSMFLARAYALAGRRTEALKILREVEKLPVEAGRPIRDIALIYDALGDKDRAFVWLEKSYKSDDRYLAWSMKLDPRFDNLRSDPRFADLLHRIGLPP